MSNIVHITTEAEFSNQVIESKIPVLVDFWAEWCAPCKAISPILEEVATEYEGQLLVAKINIEENQQLPTQYGVRSIPTLLLLKGGDVQDIKIGSVSKSQLVDFIKSVL